MPKNQYLYSADMPMSDAICGHYDLLLVITRFGISLGFGDRSIREVCESYNVHTPTLLAVINTVALKIEYDENSPEVLDHLDPKALIAYLKDSHHYFLDYRMPVLRGHLLEAMEDGPKDIANVIMRFFDEYVEQVHKHMGYENKTVFPYVEKLLEGKTTPDTYNIEVYSRRHDRIESKITELKNILIKYYPDGKGFKLTTILYDIFATEEDLAMHNFVEDHLFVPTIRRIENKSR